MKKLFFIISLFSIFTFVLPSQFVGAQTKTGRVAHVAILIYHSVRPYYPGITNFVKEYTVPPNVFDDQLKYLRENGFNPITPDMLSTYWTKGTPLPAKPFMITLDDGWENQYVYAYPILKKYGYPGVFYVYPGAVDKRHFLTWTEIKKMYGDNMIIADHSFSHPELPKIKDSTILKKEIAGSKDVLEKKLGISIKDFAYPFGEYNDQDIQVVKDSGYRMARTVRSGFKADSNSPFTVDGIIITGDFNRFVSAVNK